MRSRARLALSVPSLTRSTDSLMRSRISRAAVEVGGYDGRIPDLVFVREDRRGIIQERAIYGVPDLVIEVISPGDRRAHLVALETEYRRMGVPEILFIDRRKAQVRALRLDEQGDYQEETITRGEIRFDALNRVTLPLDVVLDEPRPATFDVVSELLAREGAA